MKRRFQFRGTNDSLQQKLK
uniref:Uncharacterized protein n=1 Tax=Anguilla anguilla TaxID=7936 RepID=A0A0E9R1A5_ANGAN